MRAIPQAAFALALFVPAVSAGDLDVSVESGGSNTISVNPGTTVNYAVVAELTDLMNEGLAGVTFDLSFDGGPLPQAASPTAGNMLHFTDPMGLSNPAGFGGTQSGGDLLQVGGAQNTFNNTFTSSLSGTVATGVAWLGSPETIVTGTLTVPFTPGTYTLAVTNLAANAIRQGQTGAGFWAVDGVDPGQIDQLTIHVLEVFSGDVGSFSILSGGTQTWSLDAGPAHASEFYWVAGSLSGTSPGFPFAGITVPLNPDVYFNHTITFPNQAPLVNSLGLLNGAGHANGAFTLPPASYPVLIGTTVHHAYVLGPVVDFSSNPVSLTFLP
jgi:hypothetical protein